MPVLSELGRLAERGELEMGEEVDMGTFVIGRTSRLYPRQAVGRYWVWIVRHPKGSHLWPDGTLQDSISGREGYPPRWEGLYDTLTEAVDHLYMALIQAGEV